MMKLSILLFAAAVLCSSVLRAGTVCVGPDTLQLGCVYTNFGEGQSYLSGEGGLSTGIRQVGVAFTPQASYLLMNIEVAAYRANADVPDAVNFKIYSGADGFPDALLETFALTGIGVFNGQPAPSTISAASVLHPLLDAGMQYWIVMDGVASSGDVTWNFNSTNKFGAAATLAEIPDVAPERWGALPQHLQGAFAIDGTPVPEPGTFVLGLALAGIAMTRRRVRG